MVAFIYNIKKNTIAAYASAKEAEAQGNAHPIFSTEKQLRDLVAKNTLNQTDLVAMYNLASGKDIKKFADKETAITRTFAAVSKAHEAAVAEEKPVKEKKEPKAKAEGEQSTRGRKKGSAGKYVGKTVFATTDVNPRRIGTNGFKSFEIIRGKKNGVPYADYLAAGGRTNDLQWDVDKGHAKVA
jgi:hypothetical protein